MKDRGRRKRRQPAEVVANLRQADESLAAGKPIAEVARSLWVAPATLHRLRKECGPADRDPIRRLKELEKERARLKRWVLRMRELAVLRSHRGCQHIMDLLHQEGWTSGTRLMKRLWRAEGLLVVLDEPTAIRSAPGHLRSDNGPEFICGAVTRWCAQRGTGTLYIDPGRPGRTGSCRALTDG